MRHRSTKKIRPLSELVGERIFTLPSSMANSFDTVEGKPCILVQVNGLKHYIPVETPTPIAYAAFCALKDIGILEHYDSYSKGESL